MKFSPFPRKTQLKGKRVLVRVDFNVPLTPDGGLTQDGEQKIRAIVPTIKKLQSAGARIILVSHLGRPNGRRIKSLSLSPVVKRLGSLLGSPVLFVQESITERKKIERRLEQMQNGHIALLENLRFYKGEETNSASFAKNLAALGDLYINEAFAVAHRKAASTVAITKYLPSYAGLLFRREVEQLLRITKKPKSPFVLLLGGAKLETKLPLIRALAPHADAVLIGGAMANAFFAAKKYEIGKSKPSPRDTARAKMLGSMKGKNFLLPIDVVVATRKDKKAKIRIVKPGLVKRHEYILDIGPETVRLWAKVLKSAKTIVWNGPMGFFEEKKFQYGTIMLGRVVGTVSSGKAFGVVGGGETVQALMATGMADYVDHVSTGGGAMLAFLSGKSLPAISLLK